MGPDNRVGSLGDFPVLVEDLVSYPVEVFTTHVALRGTYIPGTVRCTSGHPGRAPSYLGRGQSSSGLLIYCFADVRVNAYLLGTGPSTLTVTVYTSLYQSVLAFGGDDEDYGLEQLESRRLAYERALSEGGRFQYNPPLRGFLPPGGGLRPLRREYDTLDEAHEPNGPAVIGPPGGIGGREAVLFIGPSYRASVEAWMVFWTWDVERREDGVVVALHPYRHYFDTRLNEHYAEMELPALTRAVTTAHQARVAANGGRIGEDTDLPMLETDANRLRQYFSDPKVGGYAPGVPAPAQPPPPCGLAVPDQGDNPGLMRDCMALLAAKDTLAGTATLDWSVDSAITDWEGVTVAGTPSRVTKVLLSNESLSGSIPVELGDLSELTHLNLSSNSLTGEIPRELGGLSNLQEIRLSGNSLTGCIPAPLKEVPTNDLGSLNLLYCPPTPAPTPTTTLTPTPASVPTPTPTAAPVTTTTLEPLATPALNSTQTAKTAPAPTYLNEEIPPCTPVTGSSVDPCEPRVGRSETTGTGSSMLSDLPYLVSDLLGLSWLPLSATHVVLRGTYLPGTVRCTSGNHIRRPSYIGRGQSSSGLLIYCFADVRVNAYLLGTGPSTLTVTVDRSLYQSIYSVGDNDEDYGLEQLESRRLAYERGLSEGGRFQYDPPLRGYLPPGEGLGPLRHEYDTLDEAHEPNGPTVTGPPGGIGGREAVLFVRPSGSLSVEVWEVAYTWDVERREDGTVVAIHPYWYDSESYRSLLEMELPALTQAVTTAHQARVAANGGRIGEDTDLPMLVTDANRLRQYFSDPKVGGYAPGVPAPAQPPSPCGLAVPDQGDNPGLMRDCMALLAAKDTLAGTATLDWGVDSAITGWEGVTAAGTPSRVTKLLLSNESLSGSIPAELGNLSELTHLNLSSNSLTGEIPRELGGLSNLQEIRLSGNSLTGCIPAPLKEVPTNDLGSLNLLYCPPAPEGLTAGTVAECRVPLSWTAVSNASKYRVEYRPLFASDWVVDDDTLIGVSHTVDGLTFMRDYLFRVSAYGNGTVHAAAWSDPSDSVSVTTGECVPPTFGAASYSFSLAGDADVGSAVGSVSATGSLADDTVTYSITAGDEGGKFAIDDSTGQITVAGDLNSSVGTSFTLTVEASDTSGGSATVTVTVRVTKT